MFDPSKPHGLCYGDTPARYYQLGKYYNGQGEEIDPTEVKPEKKTRAEREEELLAMKPFSVMAIFREAGGPEELTKGKGAKDRMIAWLLDNR